MKIIATIGKIKLMVEVSADELSKLTGLHFDDYDRKRNGGREFEVGDEIQVGQMYSKFHEIQDQRKKLNKIKSEAQALIESCSKIEQITKKIAQYPEIEEE